MGGAWIQTAALQTTLGVLSSRRQFGMDIIGMIITGQTIMMQSLGLAHGTVALGVWARRPSASKFQNRSISNRLFRPFALCGQENKSAHGLDMSPLALRSTTTQLERSSFTLLPSLFQHMIAITYIFEVRTASCAL